MGYGGRGRAFGLARVMVGGTTATIVGFVATYERLIVAIGVEKTCLDQLKQFADLATRSFRLNFFQGLCA